MKIEEFLSLLKYVRPSRTGWIAKCPSHPDKNPSLSIAEADGKILLRCHAGCTVESICSAVGIEFRDLFLEQRAASRVIAQYTYMDETGMLLYVVERREPKDFRQRRPDGNGDWIWNLDGIRRVLYRLPEVLQAKSVLISEGEKDCETARKMGLVATCNAGGAGKWREDYSECLRGKRVAIIADRDEPGRKHAQQVARSLYGKVESLKLLELPNAKDLTEWAEKGETRAALLDLICATLEWKFSSHTTSGFALKRLADLLARPDVPVEYVVENLLVSGTVSCL